MEAHKNISDMSFEEFFSEPKTRAEKVAGEKAVPPKSGRKEESVVQKRGGFSGAGPKVNYTAGRFQLYVPRYSGFENDQFNAAIDCAQGIIPMGRIDAVKQKGGRTSRPTTLDLTTIGVSPLEGFKLTMDGEAVFENKPRQIMFFNNIGLPLGKPAGEVYAVRSPSTGVRLVKAEVIDEVVRDGLIITHLDVSMAGGVWIDETVKEVSEPIQDQVSTVEPEVPAQKKKAPVKKVRVKSSVILSQAVKDAEAVFEGTVLQINDSGISASVSIEGCEYNECTVTVKDRDGDIISESGASPSMNIDTGDAFGPVTISVVRNGKSLADASCFLIPGFEYSFEGKGDMTDDPSVTFSVCGERFSRNMFDDDAYGPYDHNGTVYSIRWYVPAVSYDLGNGSVRDFPTDVDIMQLSGDHMRVTVKGARKKSLFFGGDKGKKRDVTPDWTGDSYDIDLESIREEVYSNPSSTFHFFITVNSFPNRRFMTIRNPVRMKASFSEGNVVVEMDSTVPGGICRLYGLENSVSDVELSTGTNLVPVSDDIIEAEVMEMDGEKVRMVIPVQVRRLPFLRKDAFGSLWLYISRSKRIPLPDGLIVNGKPVMDAVKSWHERIVRMNPELRTVTLKMMQDAFSNYGE